MLTASKNIMQEEWVQRWLDKLTPKQKVLVTEVLEDFGKHRRPISVAKGGVVSPDSILSEIFGHESSNRVPTLQP